MITFQIFFHSSIGEQTFQVGARHG
jgi:hypothetical protein